MFNSHSQESNICIESDMLMFGLLFLVAPSASLRCYTCSSTTTDRFSKVLINVTLLSTSSLSSESPPLCFITGEHSSRGAMQRPKHSWTDRQLHWSKANHLHLVHPHQDHHHHHHLTHLTIFNREFCAKLTDYIDYFNTEYTRPGCMIPGGELYLEM